MKWVAGFAANNAVGLPAINAVVVLNDAATGLPTAILDGGPITGAADGGRLGRGHPPFRAGASTGRPPRAALIGAGRPGPQPSGGPRPRAAGRRADAVRPPPGAGRGAGRGSARRPTGIGDGRRSRPTRGPRSGTPTSSSRPPRSGPVRQVMTERLAGRRRARRAGRLRHVLRRRGRARRGALPGRRPRPVPGQPRCRAVRRLPGSDGDARRGDPRRDDARRRPAGSS